MSLLRLIRFPNLIIVAITQVLMYFVLLLPTFQQFGLESKLDYFHFILLVLTTILIAAGGYIINDIVDYEIDLINKPNKVFINKHISKKAAWYSYWSMSVFGLIISFYLAYHVDNLLLVAIYPLAVGLLHLYSISWKKRVLIGNIVVSLFCAFVPGIVLFAEREAVTKVFYQDHFGLKGAVSLLLGYTIFAFLSTMYREIIKDIEDQDGDAQQFCQTLPVVHGEALAKQVALLFGMALLFCLLYWLSIQWPSANVWSIAFLIGLVITPLSSSLFLLYQAKTRGHYTVLSLVAKFIMLTGLLYLFLV